MRETKRVLAGDSNASEFSRPLSMLHLPVGGAAADERAGTQYCGGAGRELCSVEYGHTTESWPYLDILLSGIILLILIFV